MKKVVIAIIILVALLGSDAVVAQISRAYVGNKSASEVQKQLDVINGQITILQTQKNAELSAIKAERVEAEESLEDTNTTIYDEEREEKLARLDSLMTGKVQRVEEMYASKLEIMEQQKLDLLNSMASSGSQTYISGSGSAKNMALIYATGQMFSGNNTPTGYSQPEVRAMGIVINEKRTPVDVKIVCRENSLFNETFSLVGGESKEIVVIPGYTYTFFYSTASGEKIASPPKRALSDGTFVYNETRYLVGSKIKDRGYSYR